MVLGEALRTTLEEVWSHKLRSALTLVGVVLGTMAVVTMVSLIEAVKVEVWNGIASLGLDGVMFIRTAEPRSPLEARRSHLSGGLTTDDARRLAGTSPLIAAAAPFARTHRLVAWGETALSVPVIGTTPDFRVVLNRRIAEGRFLSPVDLERHRSVAVLGHLLADELFGSSDPVGRWIRIGDHRFEVVGVGARIGNSFVNSGFSRREMRSVILPLSTWTDIYGGGQRVPLMAIRVASTEGLGGTLAYLKNHLWRHHNRVEDFEVENVAAEILREGAEIEELLRGWTVVLFAISAISLVVGGVGIFSVLQISLAERLYEIGLRKSMGARDVDMLVQFLVEAVFLSALGALVGTGLGAGLCAVLGPHFEAGLPLSGFAVTLAAVFAVTIGLAAGIYPSLRAARLTPVEALRG